MAGRTPGEGRGSSPAGKVACVRPWGVKALTGGENLKKFWWQVRGGGWREEAGTRGGWREEAGGSKNFLDQRQWKPEDGFKEEINIGLENMQGLGVPVVAQQVNNLTQCL